MHKRVGAAALPGWVIAVAVAAGIILVAVIAWRAFGRPPGEGSPPPDRTVKPGTYDFRQEALKGNLGRRHR